MPKKYKLIGDSGALNIESGVGFLFENGNRNYKQYQAWLAKGNTPDPADPPIEPSYREKRAKEYPDSIADLVDEVLTVMDGAGLIDASSKLRAMQDARLVIKDKYPK